MHRPRDVTTQISSLAEQLSSSATISIALYLLTFFTVVGVSIYLYRRHRHGESSLVYAPLNSPLELLPVAERTPVELGTPSRQGKKRMAAVLARKARRVWARGKKITFGTRKWGRRNKKVVHWDLPEDDHLEYTDEESVSEFEDEPEVRQPHGPALMVPVTDKSLIDLSHIIMEDDIGEPNKHGLELVEFAPRQQRLTAWPILTPTSSVSSNPSPNPSEDLVDLRADDTGSVPFSRYKFPSVPTMPLLPSPPMTTPIGSPRITYKIPVLDQSYGLDLKKTWIEHRVLAPPKPKEARKLPVLTIEPPVWVPPPPTAASFLGGSSQQPAVLPSPSKTDLQQTRVDAKVESIATPSSEILDAQNELVPAASSNSAQQELANDDGSSSGQQLSNSSSSSAVPLLVSETEIPDEAVPLAHDPIIIDPSNQPSTAPHATKDVEEVSTISQPLHIRVPPVAPGRVVLDLDPELSPIHHTLVMEEDADIITEDMVVGSLSPLPSPLLPHSPELRSALLTPEHTPMNHFTFSHPPSENMEALATEEILEEEEQAISVPVASGSPLIPSPTLPSGDFDNDNDNDIHDEYHENNDLLEGDEEEADSYCSDPELPSLPASPSSTTINTLSLIDSPTGNSDLTIPDINISVLDVPICEIGDPPVPSLIYSSPPRPRIAPIQTPTPPPSPPGQISPLPASPYPRIGALARKDSESSSPLSPQTKPAWSLRASDSQALGLQVVPGRSLRSSPAATPTPSPSIQLSTSLPGSFIDESEVTPSSAEPTPTVQASTEIVKRPLVVDYEPPRLRNLRSPVDIALAMQLRPGLGLGADPAWMVRFLMAMFGWMAVLVGQAGDF